MNNLKNNKHFYTILIIFAIIGLISIISYLIGFSICAFYNITGIPCPACGMTRAYISLFHFDIKSALFFNPLFFIVPFCILPQFLKCFFNIKIKKSTQNAYYFLILFILILVWIIRMYLYFPNIEPMVYNTNSLFYKIYMNFTS